MTLTIRSRRKVLRLRVCAGVLAAMILGLMELWLVCCFSSRAAITASQQSIPVAPTRGVLALK